MREFVVQPSLFWTAVARHGSTELAEVRFAVQSNDLLFNKRWSVKQSGVVQLGHTFQRDCTSSPHCGHCIAQHLNENSL
jgi:hypothetical protein